MALEFVFGASLGRAWEFLGRLEGACGGRQASWLPLWATPPHPRMAPLPSLLHPVPSVVDRSENSSFVEVPEASKTKDLIIRREFYGVDLPPEGFY